MAVGTGDLLQIIDNQRYLDQDLMNVYYYRYSSTPTLDNTIYSELADDFQSIIVDGMLPLQVDTLEHVTIEIKNLSNGVDVFTKSVNVFGALGAPLADCLPSYMALSWRLIRDSLVTRNGSKRIAGLQENMVEGNTFVGNMTDVDGFTSALESPLHAGILEVAFPIIVKRPIVVPSGTSYVYSSVSSVLFNGLSTQNTRKP